MSAIDIRALAAGIILERPGEGADPVPDATKEALAAALGPVPPQQEEGSRQSYVPEWLNHTHAFGVTLQLYQLRSTRNLGIGDLGDLDDLIPTLAAAGCDFVGLNPLHALFTADPERASPFSPSDRRFLNPLIVAADRVPGYHPEMADGIDVPDAAETVDYSAAAGAKLTILRRIFNTWQEADIAEEVRREVAEFRTAGGEGLTAFALFEALSHTAVTNGAYAGWMSWPEAYRDRHSAEVVEFAADSAADVEFHAWLQAITARQVKATHALALSAGMRIGLYLDLAVGAAPDGAQTWADPDLVMRGLRVGAPPDLFSSEGQDWGLAPFDPSELIQRNSAPYREIMDAVMSVAGAMRIDHAMGLERLWYIPDGATSKEGAYVRQGLTDALVDATHQHRTLVIGEDLGIVPPGFRERMARRRIFSMRILAFEKDDDVMRPLGAYPADSLACLSTHDIAPLEAWWAGDEILRRLGLSKLTEEDAHRELRGRRGEKVALLHLAGLDEDRADAALTEDIVIAYHRVAASTSSRLVAVRLEDVVGGRRLVNLPGTDREHPNWRNTLPLTVAEITHSERLARTLAAVRAARGEDR